MYPAVQNRYPQGREEIFLNPFVDLDASKSTGENERPVSMKKKVRITMSTAESCSEINSSFDKRDEKDFI